MYEDTNTKYCEIIAIAAYSNFYDVLSVPCNRRVKLGYFYTIIVCNL